MEISADNIRPPKKAIKVSAQFRVSLEQCEYIEKYIRPRKIMFQTEMMLSLLVHINNTALIQP